LNALRTGNNALAIQGLNQSNNDTDFLILPELVEYQITARTNHYFATPTPGGPNGAGFYAFVADTKFDHDRGFYDAASASPSPRPRTMPRSFTPPTARYPL